MSNQVKAIMTAQQLGYPELRGSIQTLKYPAFGEIKLDGELAWHIWNEKEDVIFGKNGKITEHAVLDGVSVSLGETHGITIGELYAYAGKFGDLYKLKDPKFQLRYRPFDIIQLDGEDLRSKPLIERKEILLSLLPGLAMPRLIENVSDALAYAKFVMSEGYEGVVLKNLEERYKIGPCAWVKVKTKDENVYAVQNIDPVQERIEFSVQMANGKTRLVGVKCLHRDKALLKVGDLVKIEHQGVLALGGLRHPVYKGKA